MPVIRPPKEERSLRARLPSDLKGRLVEVLDKKGLSQADFGRRIVQWFCDQPDLLQSMILGQIDTDDECELLKLLLKQLEKRHNQGDEP